MYITLVLSYFTTTDAERFSFAVSPMIARTKLARRPSRFIIYLRCANDEDNNVMEILMSTKTESLNGKVVLNCWREKKAIYLAAQVILLVFS